MRISDWSSDVCSSDLTARLGLWGPGTAFRDRDAFLAAMEEGGIAAMEIVARDTKAMGLYTARALSFAGVEYDPLAHKITSAQNEISYAYADAWAVLHRNVYAAFKSATNSATPRVGKDCVCTF